MKKIIVPLFVLVVVSFLVHGDLPLKQVYGLYDNVKDKFKHLSPFHGFVLSNKEVFYNYYVYAPQDDKLAKLIRELFFIDEFGAFKPTSRKQNIASQFTPEIIGSLFSLVESYYDSEGLFKPVGKLRTELQKVLKAKLPQAMHGRVDNFVGLLVNALTVSSRVKGSAQTEPLYTAYDVLLRFMYNTLTAKEELKPYFNAFSNLDNGTGILTNQDFWDTSYEQPDKPQTQAAVIAQKFNETLDDQLWDYAIKNYEKLGYTAVMPRGFVGKEAQLYPPHITYGQIRLSWFSERKTNQPYSGCMEAAVRNVLDYIFYDPETVTYKTDTYENTPLGNYYKQFDISATKSAQADNSFGDLVANRAGIEYVRRVKQEKNGFKIETKTANNAGKPYSKPAEPDGWYYYELNASQENLTKVINFLLNLNLPNYGAFLKLFALKCEATANPEVCLLTNQKLKTCRLGLRPGHGYVEEFVETKEEVEDKIGKIQQIIDEAIAAPALTDRSSQILPMINLFGTRGLTWFRGQELQRVAHGPYGHYSTLWRSLRSFFDKSIVIGLGINQTFGLAGDSWYKSVALNLLDKIIMLHDPATNQSALQHFITPEIVPSPELIAKLEQLLEPLSLYDLASAVEVLPHTITWDAPIVKKAQSLFTAEKWGAVANMYDFVNTVRKLYVGGAKWDHDWLINQIGIVKALLIDRLKEVKYGEVISILNNILKYRPEEIWGSQWIQSLLKQSADQIRAEFITSSAQGQGDILFYISLGYIRVPFKDLYTELEALQKAPKLT